MTLTHSETKFFEKVNKEIDAIGKKYLTLPPGQLIDLNTGSYYHDDGPVDKMEVETPIAICNGSERLNDYMHDGPIETNNEQSCLDVIPFKNRPIALKNEGAIGMKKRRTGLQVKPVPYSQKNRSISCMKTISKIEPTDTKDRPVNSECEMSEVHNKSNGLIKDKKICIKERRTDLNVSVSSSEGIILIDGPIFVDDDLFSTERNEKMVLNSEQTNVKYEPFELFDGPMLTNTEQDFKEAVDINNMCRSSSPEMFRNGMPKSFYYTDGPIESDQRDAGNGMLNDKNGKTFFNENTISEINVPEAVIETENLKWKYLRQNGSWKFDRHNKIFLTAFVPLPKFKPRNKADCCLNKTVPFALGKSAENDFSIYNFTNKNLLLENYRTITDGVILIDEKYENEDDGILYLDENI